MKYFFAFLIFISITLNATISEQDKATISGPNNLILNSGFEGGQSGWTATGGTFLSSAVNPLFGLRSGHWNLGSTAGVRLQSELVTLPRGLLGRTCQVGADYRLLGTPPQNATIGVTVKVITSANVVLTEIPLSVTDVSSPFLFFFTCPSTAGTRFRVAFETTGNFGNLEVDNVFLGNGKENLATPVLRNQSIWGASGTRSGNGPVTNYTILTDHSVGSGVFSYSNGIVTILREASVVVGADQTSSTNNLSGIAIQVSVPGILLGNFRSISSGQCMTTSTTTHCSASASQILPAGSRIQFTRIGSGTGQSTSQFTVTALSIEQPLAERITLETRPEILDARIGASATTRILTNSTTERDIIDGGLVLYRGNRDSVDPFIPCQGVSPSIGQNCGSNNEVIGVRFNARKKGTWKICTAFSYTSVGLSNVLENAFFRLNKVASGASSEQKGIKIEVGENVSSTFAPQQGNNPVRSCSFYDVDAGANEFRLVFAISTSGSVRLRTEGTSYDNASIAITGFPLTENFPTPSFENLTTSLEGKLSVPAGAEGLKMGSLLVQNSGAAATVIEETGDWVSSVSIPFAGRLQFNFTPGFFSERPHCFVQVYTDPENCSISTGVTASMVRTQCIRAISPTSPATAWMYLLCIGE